MKKSIFLFFAAILCAMSINAANMTGGEVLYLKPNSNWTQASAWFAMYLCNGSSSAEWVKMEKVGDYYQATVPAGKNHKNVIFCRMNPASQTLDWGNKWNQSGDLSFDQKNNLCTINSGQWDCGNNVTWSTHQPVSNASLATSAANLFVGAQATLTPSLSSNANVNTIKSTSYSVSPATGSVTDNKFTATADGEYTVTATVTYYPNGCTNLTSGLKTATATATITVEEPAEATHDVTISYMCAGTSIKTADQVAAVGEETASLVEAPEISNYTFSSWTLGSGVTSADDLSASSINIKTLSTGDYTLTAKYEKFKLTYTVTVPAGTENCYLVGEMNGWDVDNPIEMANQGNNIFKVVLEDVTTDMQYKYISKKGTWDYSEVGDNRTWTANDVVTAWKDPLATDVYLAGSMTDWANSKLTFKKATIDATTATVSVELAASTEYYFKVIRGGEWTSSKDNRDIKATVSGLVFSKDISDDTKLTTAAAGNYVFTWDINQSQLSIAYPEVTPEYEDITIQVYAKQVPNIWWWNGGDQCPSTEDIVNPSTGNKYQWNEAPAMEKVAGEDNWYTKTFAQVDITKGGIKFKLQSTDHSISTTNEVVTTENKCYDARVIATVTETTCGELPSGEVPTVTYNVTVPTGTPACYIAGQMTGWSHQAMTKVDETHYTITIEGAEKTQKYKYSASNNWDWVELNEDGSEKSDREWTENDVVAKWATPPTYTIVGATAITGENWNLASTNNIMIKDGEAYTLTKTGLKLEAGDYEYKVAKNGAWGDGQYPAEGNQKVTITETAEYTIVYTYTVGTSLTAVATKTGEYTPVQTVYTVAGDVALCGTNWQADDATNDMTANGDGTFTWKKTDVKLTSNVGFKVVKNHDFGNGQYPAENWNINLVDYEGAAVYTVTITFTESSKEIAVTLTKTGEATPPVITYVLMGVNGDWDNGIALTQNPGNEDEYVLENQVIIKATDAVKVVTLTDGTATAWCGNVDTWSNATYTGGGNDNIVLEDGIYTFYFKKTANNIYINQTGYARDVTVNNHGTICLPYASSNYAGAEFYEVAGKEEGKVVLDQVTTLEAGVPYIFKATANKLKVVYEGEAADASNINGLHGTFTDNTSVAEGMYIVYENQFRKCGTGCIINANRAYLNLGEVNNGVPAQMPGRKRVGMAVTGENGTTDVDNIVTPNGKATKVLHNGQIIIIRNGEKFNTMGIKF